MKWLCATLWKGRRRTHELAQVEPRENLALVRLADWTTGCFIRANSKKSQMSVLFTSFESKKGDIQCA
jgi:hypothetical protein